MASARKVCRHRRDGACIGGIVILKVVKAGEIIEVQLHQGHLMQLRWHFSQKGMARFAANHIHPERHRGDIKHY